jgi:hypothetical protein
VIYLFLFYARELMPLLSDKDQNAWQQLLILQPAARLNYRNLAPDFPCNITPAFAAGVERSGKPVRQHALVSFGFSRH